MTVTPPRQRFILARRTTLAVAIGLAAVLGVLALLPNGRAVVRAAPGASFAQQPTTATATLAPTARPTAQPSDTPRPTNTRPGPPPTWTRPPTSTPVPSATVEPTETTRPKADIHRPLLVIENMQVDPRRPSPGSTFKLEVDVVNAGDAHAHNVRFSWSSEIFLPEGESTQHFEKGIPANDEHDFDARARVASTVKAGTYPIQVTVSWEDGDGAADTTTANLAVEVGGQSAVRPLLSVTAWRAPGWVVPGIAFGVAFDIVNTGGREARNVQIVPAGGSVALASQASGGVLNIGGGGSATQSLRLIAAASAEQQAVAQPMELRYDDEDGTRYTESLTIGFGVVDPDADQPLPMIESYRVRPANPDIARTGAGDATTLHPGEVFWLDLSILNVGRQAAVRSFLAFGGGAAPSAADGAGSAAGAPSLGVFAPLGRSNRVFLGRIEAGGGTTVTQRMVADGSAKPGVYALDVAMSYDDAEGKTLQSSEIVTLLLSRPAQLQFSAVNVMTSTVVGQSVPFAVEIINGSANTLNVSQVTVEGDRWMGVTGGSRYVGPLDDGGSDVIEAVLDPKAPGTATVTVIVAYVDDFNQTQEVRESYEFEVAEAPPEVEGADEPPPPTRSLFARVLRGLFGLGASPPAPVTAPAMDGAIEIGPGSGRAAPGGGQAEPAQPMPAEPVSP
jgi:hypothetical protein